MKSRFTRFLLVLLTALQGACVSATRPDPAPADNGLVLDTAQAPSLSGILPRLEGERLIYVPETHTRNADHQLQLAVLRALPPERTALGVEWFQARFQPALDDFIAGRIDEAGMLRRTGYFERWRFDYRLYRPIIRYARAHHIPIIALNASRELTDAIHASGIAGLSAEMKKALPDHYDYSDRAYDRILRRIFEQHRREDAAFERFREVQLTWDETMAQHIAEYLKAHPQRRMLVLAGRGHVAGRHGIPRRATRRSGIRGTIISSYDPGLPVRGQADYLVLNDDDPLPPRGLIGALLDIAGGRVMIKSFTPGSAGRAAGLEKGDRIIGVDGQTVSDFAQFKLAMLDKRAGDRVRLRVHRKHLIGHDEDLDIEVRLKGQNPSPHGR